MVRSRSRCRAATLLKDSDTLILRWFCGGGGRPRIGIGIGIGDVRGTVT